MKDTLPYFYQILAGDVEIDGNVITYLEEFYLYAKDMYYKGNEVISDPEFDQMEEILKSYGSRIVEVVDGDSTIGERFQHYTKMLSLEKEQINNEDFESEETSKAISSIHRFINRAKTTEPIDYEATSKYDGNAISLQYIDGELKKALTRGEEAKGGGLDKYEKMKLIVPNTIKLPGVVEVRGEVVIDKRLWQKKYSDPEKIDNPRNYVAGVLGKDDIDPEVIKDLTFVAIQLVENADKNPIQPENSMKKLGKLGFNDSYDPFLVTFQNIDEFIDVYMAFKHYRENICKFQLDGIVLKFEEKYRQELGETSHHPKWAMAVKFPPQRVTTTIIDIIWTTKTTGFLTPVAILKPVELDGTEVKRASLHNYSRILKIGATIGAVVEIAKKGDIIPQVVAVKIPGDGTIPQPKTCECGGEIKLIKGKGDTENLKCMNPTCEVQALTKFETGIKVLKIERVGPAVAAELYKAGFKSVIDLFDKSKFNKQALIDSGYFKEGRHLEIVLNAVGLIKKVKINDLIHSLKFENCGRSISREMGKYLSGITYETKGLQKDVIAKIMDQNSIERELIAKFIEILSHNGVDVEFNQEEIVNSNTIFFEMTGRTTPYFKTKSELKSFLKDKGMVHAKLNENCHMLLTDSYSSGSSKMTKAEKLGVEIVTYEDILERYN
jgi:DNA ligase (NAD+)